MVGEDGLEEELEMVGLKVVKEGARPAPGMTEDEFREDAKDHDPEVSGGVVRAGCFGQPLSRWCVVVTKAVVFMQNTSWVWLLLLNCLVTIHRPV